MTLTTARTNLENTLRWVIAGLAEIGILPAKGYLPDQRKALWKEFDATARKWEARFRAAAKKALEHDRREILAIVGEAKKAALREKASIDWKKILKQIEDYLEEAGEEFWRTTFIPLIEGIVIDQGEKWAGRLGIEFDVQNLRARSWFNDYTLQFAKPINDTTEREIAQIMARAQAEGSSIPKIQNQLNAMFERELSGKLPDDPEWEWFLDRLPPYRIEAIARTETIRASNNGTNELFKEWGVKRHEWLSTKDDRTRSYDAGDEFDHVEADGQVVPIDTPFIVSGEDLMYPGDPTGSPGNTINCRCTLIPVIEEGEELQPTEPAEAVETEVEPGPAGTPVSDALDNTMTGKYGKSVDYALEQLNSVHGDGELPDIPITRSSAKSFLGQYSSTYGGKPVEIKISIKGDHPETTILHEIGHFLDHQALGNKGIFVSEGSSDLVKGWQKAVQESSAFKKLAAMLSDPSLFTKEVTVSDGFSYKVAPDTRHLRYLYRGREAFARSYAQYIATKSNDPLLKSQIAIEAADEMYGARQWADDDFKPIAKAFDEMFKKLGWIK